MNTLKLLLVFSISLLFLSCGIAQKSKTPEKGNPTAHSFEKVYASEHLIIYRIAENTYQHLSYLETTDFGKVPCNGMIVLDSSEALIFDSPATMIASEELIKFLSNTWNARIIGVVPTHFHEDCWGGLSAFEAHQIPAFATQKTIDLLRKSENEVAAIIQPIPDKHTFRVGQKIAETNYFGEGHTVDNIVAYFPSDDVLFGGCLIKELGAGFGNLSDANTKQWATTVSKLKLNYPNTQFVIPGHGLTGDKELLNYTMQLFKQ